MEIQVDTLVMPQNATDGPLVRIIGLKSALTIHAVLHRLAQPDGIESAVAEELLVRR